MTQRQKRTVAYICACGSVVTSFGLWTAIVSRSLVIYNTDISQERQRTEVWGGAIGTVGEFVESVAEVVANTVMDQVHLAASTVTVPSEVIGGPAASSSGAESPFELSQWEINQAYTLSIPDLDVEVPVLIPSMRYWESREWNLLEKQMQVGLNYGAVAYPHSAEPGSKGSVIISGHSSPPSERAASSDFGRIFSHVPELKPGDVITISGEGQDKNYEIQSSVIVPPTATEILRQQEDESIMKIVTCYPIGTTKDRMVVTAKLME